MTKQSNHEAATSLVAIIAVPPESDHYRFEKAHTLALLAVADELRALRKMLAKYPWPIIASDGRVAYINPEIQCPECEATTQDWTHLPRATRPSGTANPYGGQDYY